MALTVAATLAPAALANAAWTVSSSGAATAGAAATTMPTGTTPAGVAGIGQVTVSWTAAVLGDGAAVGGYVINRYDATSGTLETVNGGCSGIVVTTSCTESPVPAGNWVYTDTPVLGSWTGGQSAASASVLVNPT